MCVRRTAVPVLLATVTLTPAPPPSCPRFPAVTAGTGFVGVRVPAHPIAAALLVAAAVPVAAPSANRFGHVSPTRAAHVVADLGEHPIGVLLGEGPDDTGPATCGVGIESTVVKVEAGDADDAAGRDPTADSGASLVVFRRGGVSEPQLRAALDGAGLADVSIRFHTLHSTKPSPAPVMPSLQPPPSAPAAVSAAVALGPADEARVTSEAAGGAEAPGMLLTHYAPSLPTIMLSGIADAATVAAPSEGGSVLTLDPRLAGGCAVIDFGGALATLAPHAAGYRDLSPAGDVVEARGQVFDALRWTEAVRGARQVLLADVGAVVTLRAAAGEAVNGAEHADAVRDRLYRAASGVVMQGAWVAE
jgi:L-threonylcarbamoyladenylate synthase